MSVNFSRPVWSLLGWVCVAVATFGAGVVYGQYASGTIVVPHYGAGAGPQTGEPAPPEPQPEWAKRVESKVDKLLKLLEELDDKTPDKAESAPPASDLFFRGDLSPTERERVARKVLKVGKDQMPPPDSEQLAADEKTAVVAAFRGQKFDEAKLGSAAGKCVNCHSPTAAAKKGDGFVLFQNGEKKP